MKPLTPHWADIAAVKLASAHPEQETLTVASGITPSGTVHIGNFREVITVDFVARALRSIGRKVRFIYSWDDFDTFRKVPSNLPNQDMLKEHLRKPIVRVPDPYEKTESYAKSNIEAFEAELQKLGIEPEYLYQHQRYGDGRYADEIKTALESKEQIKEILNKHRSTPLADDWLPTAIYCENCDHDEMEMQRYDGGYDYSYHCANCGHKATVDIRKTKNLKLNWRTDWPMRWAFEKVDFEPGGKDHSSDGGSYDTAKDIVAKVWGQKPPQYLQYDFVMIRGLPGKMSSSKGNLITLSDAFTVYSPQMVRWIFANHRPNTDFALAFDLDVIKVYDEFDRAEKAALGPKPAKLGKWPSVRRTYELSCVDEVPDEAPYRPPFRDLCSRLQILDGDAERTLKKYYSDKIVTENDRALFIERCELAMQWIEHHAPEDFKYKIHQDPVTIPLTDIERSALESLKILIAKTDLETIEPKELNQNIYDEVIRAKEIDSKAFFRVVYLKLIGREQGPRLPMFLKEIGSERLSHLL